MGFLFLLRRCRAFSSIRGLEAERSIRGLDAERLRPFLDFSKPSSFYPQARAKKRRVICHVGPTNSGKTHSALQHLVQASNGRRIYCAPLRLLAIEMYERLNKQHGIGCALRTGEITCGPAESVELAKLSSAGSGDWQMAPVTACTVEMADLGSSYEVAIIDEIQMLGDEQRGWAFTQALLGLQASTLYLCGEEAAVPLIQRICRETGDSLEIIRFKRLSELKDGASLGGNLKRVQPGDCVVAFSRKNIFALKAQIERTTGHKCAVVYGNLPMESRAQQARLFNKPGSEYGVLVASDAIGMGLNLNIKRIIFHGMSKFNGLECEPPAPAQIKQIAGRAGRFGTVHAHGTATTLHARDLPYLLQCMRLPNEETPAAGLMPGADQVASLAAAVPGMGLPEMIQLYREEAMVAEGYFMCGFRDVYRLAGVLEAVPGLSISDRFRLANAPVKAGDVYLDQVFRALAASLAHPDGRPCPLRIGLPSINPTGPIAEGSLRTAESIYRAFDLYLWLATQFPNRFLEAEEARQRRDECGRIIATALERICHVRKQNKA